MLSTASTKFSISQALLSAKNGFFRRFWLLFFVEAFMILGIRQIAEIFPGVWIFQGINGINDSFPVATVHQFFPQIQLPQLSEDVKEWVSYLSGCIIEPFCAGGHYIVLLAVIDKQSAKFTDLFSKKHYFWRYFGSNFLLTVGFLLTLSLLAIPFLLSTKHQVNALGMGFTILLIVAINLTFVSIFSFHQLLMADQDLGLKDALRKSYAITKPNRLKIFSFFLVLLILSVIITIPAFIVIGLAGLFLEKMPYLLKLLISCVICGVLLPTPIFWLLAWVGCYRQLVPATSAALETIEN